MSHQLCQNCGSNQFEHIDGRLYCVICQSQNLSLQIHVSFANEGNAQLGRRVRDQMQTTSILNEAIPKIEIIEANESIARPLNATDETISRLTDLSVDDNEQLQLEQHIWSSYEVYSYILHIQLQAILKLDVIPNDKHHEWIECTFLLYLRYLAANGIIETRQIRPSEKQERQRLEVNQLSTLLQNERYERFAKTNTHIFKKKICLLNLDILIGLIHW
jgi:uncharacterized Zn finger protein (UPF0148 family)